jgi:catechol 2,3-dioxygenase-like lactoylglutathione lyase family enzyme
VGTSTKFDVLGDAMNQTVDQYQVTLNVPHLGRAVSFYSTLLGVSPKAAKRRVAWFDVPESPLRLALREGSAPSATHLRVCTDPTRLRAATTRLRQVGVPTTASRRATDGHPRAIEFSDPGGNRLEFCAPLAAAPVVDRRRIDPAGLLRAGWQLLRRSLGAGPVDQRFDHARAQEQLMLLRRGRRT